MIITAFKLCVVFSIVAQSRADQGARKYSLEQEAFKLYGQDFQTVLKRFRRTPDYLKIVQDKLDDIKMSAKEVGLQILHYHHGKMQDRVNEILPTSTLPHLMGIDGKPIVIRRQMYDDDENDPETKIRNLDNYKAFLSELSVAERNSMKDLGFKTAGSIIHTMFQHLTVPKSNKHTKSSEESDEKVASTTKHPEQEESTTDKETDTETDVLEILTSPEVYTSTRGPDFITTDELPTHDPESGSLRAGFKYRINAEDNKNTHTIYIG